MALEMRSPCERCGAVLAPDGPAVICSYECTFCADCAEAMEHVPQLRRRAGSKPAESRVVSDGAVIWNRWLHEEKR